MFTKRRNFSDTDHKNFSVIEIWNGDIQKTINPDIFLFHSLKDMFILKPRVDVKRKKHLHLKPGSFLLFKCKTDEATHWDNSTSTHWHSLLCSHAGKKTLHADRSCKSLAQRQTNLCSWSCSFALWGTHLTWIKHTADCSQLQTSYLETKMQHFDDQFKHGSVECLEKRQNIIKTFSPCFVWKIL